VDISFLPQLILPAISDSSSSTTLGANSDSAAMSGNCLAFVKRKGNQTDATPPPVVSVLLRGSNQYLLNEMQQAVSQIIDVLSLAQSDDWKVSWFWMKSVYLMC
jgi:hypothetical protein